jgi:hypothetical protein
LHSEFRDGNVNAGFGQLRILKEAMALLPSDVKHVHLSIDADCGTAKRSKRKQNEGITAPCYTVTGPYY